MKKIAAVFTVAGIIGVALFGLVLIDASMANHGGCIATMETGAPCPVNIMDISFHHTALFQSLSNAPLPIIIMVLTFIAIIYLGFYVWLLFDTLHKKLICIARVYQSRDKLNFSRINLRNWLSIFEHSPSL